MIAKLNKKKAPGPDQITNTVLKFLPNYKIITLTRIINEYIKICYSPKVLKQTSIL